MITAGLPPDVLKRSLAQGAALSLLEGVAFALKSGSPGMSVGQPGRS